MSRGNCHREGQWDLSGSLAEAEGNKAKLLAEAEGIKAKLLAEAEGALRKAEAFQKLDESARALLILERFPEVIKAFAPVAGAVAAPLGNIDKLVMIYGGSSDGASTVNATRATSSSGPAPSTCAALRARPVS